MHRKDRVYEALRSLCVERPAQRSVSGMLRRYTGFSAEAVAERAAIDRTNASRDLNLLAHEGIIERIPGRPVLFTVKSPASDAALSTEQTERVAKREELEVREAAQKQERAPETQPEGLFSGQRSEGQRSEQFPTVAASIGVGIVITGFETLIGSHEGLKVAIQQAKAAIIYPPRGLHTLLCGPSGVGKTTFARLMHAFALELHALPPKAPFVSFNCADYAGNPQLLMAHLFGVVRGAYTGADRDRMGLVEQAHRGILFLDEVHRLPPEGQEMLFYLMDRESFRRLGEVSERQASLLLIAATTEDPSATLLPTFRRRIPMTITLPGLRERTIMERYELLRAFFTAECSSIGTNIHVAPQVLRALLLYDCPGNVGQLRTDVQLTCARAYLEYRTQALADLHIHANSLPEHVHRGLLRTADLHRSLESVQQVLEATHIFTPSGLSLNSAESTHDLYHSISTELIALRSSGLSDLEINKLLYLDIQHYFQRFAETVTHEPPEAATHLVDENIAEMSRSIVRYAEEQLARTFPENLALVLALHLTSALEHITHSEPEERRVVPAMQSMRHTYPIEYEVAHTALQRIRTVLGVSLPESEADVLTILLANADSFLSNTQSTVGIVIAAHGRGIAAGLAELSNILVGINTISPLELTLEQTPEELLARVERSVIEADQGSGVLLLVDFSSLLSLGELVTRRTGIQVRTVAGVSAPLVVEALRRAQRAEHMTLDQLAASLLLQRTADKPALIAPLQEQTTGHASKNEKNSLATRSITTQGTDRTPRIILSVCLTGFGSAIKLAELIEERLPDLQQQQVEILCIDINLSGKTEAEIQRIVGSRHIVAVVGTINPHIPSYPFISLTEVLFGDGITRLRTLLGSTFIDPALLLPSTEELTPAHAVPTFTQRADLIHEIGHTLSQRLLFLNPARILPLIEKMIELIEVEVGETFDIDVLAGLLLHLACILEQGAQQKGMVVSEHVRTHVEQQFPRELDICRRAWRILSHQIARPLPEEEAYNIVGILRQVDIFVAL